MLNVYKTLRPAIFSVEPERAHNLTLKAMKSGLMPACPQKNYPALENSVFGLNFKNPIGLAAGFDKNAEVMDACFKLGFGFVEVGTVTPKPQSGNPKPRVFRDPANDALINRMGFPNGGLEEFKNNIHAFRKNKTGIVGINIGMNKDQTKPEEDYTLLMRELHEYADYFTINISSPNTPGLRNLQEKEPLNDLLKTIIKQRKDLKAKTPILLKLAPDLNDKQCEEIAEVVTKNKIDGLILANTTLDRPDYLASGFKDEKGGLSGNPVRDKSTAIIKKFYTLTKGNIPIIGIGGVSDGASAYEKIKAGASLVQLYTGMVFEGPGIVSKIKRELDIQIAQDGFKNYTKAIGADA